MAILRVKYIVIACFSHGYNVNVVCRVVLGGREALGWNLVHNELLIQPFCPEMERLVHISVCCLYALLLWRVLLPLL